MPLKVKQPFHSDHEKYPVCVQFKLEVKVQSSLHIYYYRDWPHSKFRVQQGQSGPKGSCVPEAEDEVNSCTVFGPFAQRSELAVSLLSASTAVLLRTESE